MNFTLFITVLLTAVTLVVAAYVDVYKRQAMNVAIIIIFYCYFFLNYLSICVQSY